MLTAILSDLHLGTASGRDLLRQPEPRAALAARLRDADQVVLLGDVLELRDSRVADVVDRSRPALEALGEAIAGARVLVVPGNHDHQLAAEWLERRRRSARRGPLPLEEVTKPGRSDLLARIARHLGGDVALAYPGVWVRPDVYATHGHYLDCHNTVPSLEALAASVTSRLVGGVDRAGGSGDGERATPEAYEAALAPIYAFTYGLAQGAPTSRGVAGGGTSLAIWERLNRNQRRLDPVRLLLGRLVVPGAVAGANAAGLGPFKADLSGVELRRAALRAMGEVVKRLGIDAEHVVFGHTHRSGPLAGDGEDEGWSLPGGARLTNCGSWVHEPAFIGDRGSASPYWPGTCVIVEDAGPPRLERLLDRLPEAGHEAPGGPPPNVQCP